MSRPNTVVTLRALGLGDFLTAIPALRALERAYPDSRHLLAAPSPLRGLARLADLRAEIVDTRAISPLPGILEDMPGLLAVNLHGSGPQSHRALLASRPAGLIAFHHPEIGNDGPPWNPRQHEVERWCHLLEENGITAEPGDLGVAAPTSAPPMGTSEVCVIHPGAKDGARRWPMERWAVVARNLADGGAQVVLTGTIRERPLALELARSAGLGAGSVLAGLTDLTSLVSIVSRACLVLCGDTGMAHLASALGKPSVVLFGPTDPALWGPPANGRHIVIWKGTTGDPHADTPDQGLLAITPAEVVAAAESLRAGQPVG